MKKLIYLITLLLTCKTIISSAQVLCIYCYDQNAPVSTGVNNLVVNGGFENTNCIPGWQPGGSGGVFCPNSNYYNCDIMNWTCIGGDTSTYTSIFDVSLSEIVEGTKAAYFGNYDAQACSSMQNDTSCLTQIDCTVGGIPVGYPVNPHLGFGGTTGVSLEQTVTGLIMGNSYVLEFWVGGESDNAWFTNRGLFAVDVGFGDTLLRDKPTSPVFLGTSDTIGTRFIVEFNATSSSHTIKFTNWGHIGSYTTELVLDDVRLYTLAELSASVPHCTVGIDDTSFPQNRINIYPNPMTNELNVKTTSNELSEIFLYEITSRKVLQQKFTYSVSLNTEQLAKGLYLYEVRDKNGVIKKGKVVKE